MNAIHRSRRLSFLRREPHPRRIGRGLTDRVLVGPACVFVLGPRPPRRPRPGRLARHQGKELGQDRRTTSSSWSTSIRRRTTSARAAERCSPTGHPHGTSLRGRHRRVCSVRRERHAPRAGRRARQPPRVDALRLRRRESPRLQQRQRHARRRGRARSSTTAARTSATTTSRWSSSRTRSRTRRSRRSASTRRSSRATSSPRSAGASPTPRRSP